MPITKLLSGLPSRMMDEGPFNDAVAKLFVDLPAWGKEVNDLTANLNALLAGTAYALPFTFDAATADQDPTVGKLRLSAASQSSSTVIRVSTTMAGGGDGTALLDSFDASTSTVKGQIRLVKMTDQTKWMIFAFTARASAGTYRNLTVSCIAASSASPFAAGDPVLMFFQRTGDKGDVGPVYSWPTLHVREEQATGVNPLYPTKVVSGSGSSPDVYQRVLNTSKVNTLSGASLSNNRVVLPAGTYDVRARSPMFNGWNTKLAIYSVTGASNLLVGPSGWSFDYSGASDFTDGTSEVFGSITLGATTTIELRSYFYGGSAVVFGRPLNIGLVEVYSEMFIRKTA